MTDSEKALSITPVARTEPWWQERHLQKMDEKKALNDDVDLLFLGDSITHSWEDTGAATWKKHYAHLKPLNLGYSGDCTEHLLWRLQNGEIDNLTPKLTVILIGTNNAGHRVESAQDTAAGVKAILNEVQSRLPKSKILILATFPRSKSKNAPMRKRVNAINDLVQHLTDNKNTFWLDIGHVFLTEDGTVLDTVMPDFLHLTSEQYQVWADAMQNTIARLMR
ncbi:lipolytic enzyme, G-D-S-L [Paraglaciecola sp. T6c]|uniref:platelet-activating factor acetylhydrolase IB subunit n=1 Tax=Pseudoalteromonas atlantica (strain T6c / ATCC BAA-1087) TaxID=3042615 RepID=UPI00005C60F1|nr:platelet-activating factor acetylhydrolase IB subunit [Paraglaciecola sp. T6c]ABG42280.1 lipolytic enzyme, G-D-S-L [Paraglaciecola sp. T6c]